jgi:hypothetical protein
VRKGDDASKSDNYTVLAIDALNKAIVSYQSGKRDGETTLAFVKDVRQRVTGAPMISSDEFAGYEPTIREVFDDNRPRQQDEKASQAARASPRSRSYYDSRSPARHTRPTRQRRPQREGRRWSAGQGVAWRKGYRREFRRASAVGFKPGLPAASAAHLNAHLFENAPMGWAADLFVTY